MSYRVALVCEDPTLDQFVVRPIVAEALRQVGRPRAIITTITNPHMGGYSRVEALACAVLDRWSAISEAVVFIVDADCEDGIGGRRNRRRRLQTLLDDCPAGRGKVLLVVAIQEVEVWALWGQEASLPSRWSTVRSDCNPKERFLQPLLTKADHMRPDRGRTRLVGAALRRGWTSLRGACPELAELELSLQARVVAD